MAKVERREGFEFINSDGSIWLTLPVYELSNASIEEVSHELLGWKKVDTVSAYPIMCRKANRQKDKCGWYARKIAYVKYHIIGHDIKPGEAIRILYEGIECIDFQKQQKGEVPF